MEPTRFGDYSPLDPQNAQVALKWIIDKPKEVTRILRIPFVIHTGSEVLLINKENSTKNKIGLPAKQFSSLNVNDRDLFTRVSEDTDAELGRIAASYLQEYMFSSSPGVDEFVEPRSLGFYKAYASKPQDKEARVFQLPVCIQYVGEKDGLVISDEYAQNREVTTENLMWRTLQSARGILDWQAREATREDLGESRPSLHHASDMLHILDLFEYTLSRGAGHAAHS